MSVLAIVLIVVGVLLLVFFVGGLLRARRQANRPEATAHILAADRALEQARASDRGWDRAVLERTARAALDEQRPGSSWDRVELELVDDRPGMAEDAAHLVAIGSAGSVRVVLARTEGGDWYAERVE
jgi:type II secretory pathway pseudopilin PulG